MTNLYLLVHTFFKHNNANKRKELYSDGGQQMKKKKIKKNTK